MRDKLVDPDAFIRQVKYLYQHRDQRGHEEVALVDGRTFERYSAPMVGPDEKYYGRVWHYRDITWRKQAEQALQDSEARFRFIDEETPTPLG